MDSTGTNFVQRMTRYLFVFCRTDMATNAAEPGPDGSESSDDSEQPEDTLPSFEDLGNRKAKDMRKWLSDRGLKKSGNKPALARRMYRSMRNNSSSECTDSGDA